MKAISHAGVGDVGLASDPETVSEYLVWKSERGSKTRTGQNVVIKECLNRKRTQATTSLDAQLNLQSFSKSPF